MTCVMSEYTRTVMFSWMFLEGFYLHNVLVNSVFSTTPNYLVYHLIGWGTSAPPIYNVMHPRKIVLQYCTNNSEITESTIA